jgi:hypothetical protein
VKAKVHECHALPAPDDRKAVFFNSDFHSKYYLIEDDVCSLADSHCYGNINVFDYISIHMESFKKLQKARSSKYAYRLIRNSFMYRNSRANNKNNVDASNIWHHVLPGIRFPSSR